MGFFDRIFGNRKETSFQADSYFKTLNAYTPAFTSWNGGIYESELVRAAIGVKAAHASKMQVRMVGAARPSLQAKMRVAPNEFQTWSQFLYRTMTILEVNNTAFIVPVIDADGNTTGIYTVLPSRCELVSMGGVPYVRYKFQTGETGAIEYGLCGVMTKFQYEDDFKGADNRAMTSTMQLINIQNQGIEEGVKSSAAFRFMAQVNNFVKPEDLAKERKRFTAENLSNDSGGLLLFPNTYGNIQQIKSSPFVVDADQMKLIQTNVFNYFGVNEKILQNAASGDEMDSFYNGALEPFAVQLAEVLSKMFYTIRERNQGNAVYVASDRLQYMTVANKVSMATQLGDRGMITINEVRSLFNYPPMEGGDVAPVRGEYYMMGEDQANDKDDKTEEEGNAQNAS